MKRVFYLIAIASVMMAVACNGQSKKENNEEAAGENAETQLAEENVSREVVDEQFEEYEALIDNLGDQPLSDVMDKRSYAVGVSMALNFKGLNDMLDLDITEFKEHITNFCLAGDVESEEFMEDNMAFQNFVYTKLISYSQAKQQREALEDSGVTEDLPELPELYSEEMTRGDITRILGNQLGASLQSIDNVNFAWFFRGFDDVNAIEDFSTPESVNEGLAITTEEIGSIMMQLNTELREKAMAEFEAAKQENKEASEAWLAEIEKEEGVQKTESGILYRIEREGDGDYPTADTDVVEVHYEGSLSTGEVFDSSYERDETTEFPLNRVIKGWTEGLKLINEGGKITLWLPSELAYGENGNGTIGPNQALKFEVELFSINKGEKAE